MKSRILSPILPDLNVYRSKSVFSCEQTLITYRWDIVFHNGNFKRKGPNNGTVVTLHTDLKISAQKFHRAGNPDPTDYRLHFIDYEGERVFTIKLAKN